MIRHAGPSSGVHRQLGLGGYVARGHFISMEGHAPRTTVWIQDNRSSKLKRPWVQASAKYPSFRARRAPHLCLEHLKRISVGWHSQAAAAALQQIANGNFSDSLNAALRFKKAAIDGYP
jgi:hypothetical protein